MSSNETTLSKSQFVKVKLNRSKYSVQHKAWAHTEQQAIKGPKEY